MLIRAENERKIKEFFNFIEERHSIYVKRFLLKEPAPWTQDPILATKKFCNVYRELDRGTLWYMENLVEPWKRDGEEDGKLVWQTIAYRFINTVGIFELLGGVPHPEYYEKTQFEELLKATNKKCPLNPAYTIYKAWGKIKGANGDILRGVSIILDEILGQLPELTESLEKAENLKHSNEILMQCYGVGPFLAYEITCDLVLAKFLPFTENDYVSVGPGAKRGLRLVFGEDFRKYEEACYFLRDIQEEYLKSNIITKPLTLRSIEHSLCEFRKYYNIKKNGKGGRFFKPHL